MQGIQFRRIEGAVVRRPEQTAPEVPAVPTRFLDVVAADQAQNFERGPRNFAGAVLPVLDGAHRDFEQVGTACLCETADAAQGTEPFRIDVHQSPTWLEAA